MKKILLLTLILLSARFLGQDVSVCELPLTTTVSPNDLIIIERANCPDPNGTQAIKISDLTGTGTQSSTPLYFVLAATTGSLNMTYSSGTLTAVSNGRLANQDGIKLMPNDSVLFKDQTSQLQNGIYIVLDTGTVSTPAKLYRNPNYNTTSAIYPSQVNILQGITQGGNYYYESTINPTIGTSPIVYITGVKPYVPYTNAVANVNLNAKDLTNVGAFQTNKDATINGIKIGSGYNNICNNVLLGSGLVASGGCRNTAIGKPSQTAMLLGSDNTSSGYNSLNSATSANSSTAIGSGALSSVVGGSYNVGVGAGALASVVSTTFNTGIGTSAGAQITGGFNTLIGANSAVNSVNVSNNTIAGATAGFNNTGNNNVFLGVASGYNSAGSGNVFLGYSSGYQETGSNKLYISNSNTSTPLIGGDFSAKTLVINGATTTTLSNSFANTPSAHDNSTKIATTAYVDNAVSSSTSFWSTVGNSGTTPGSKFLGTTDNQSLAFRTNNTERVRFDSLGNVGIGTSTPAITDALAIVGNNSNRKSITLQNINSSGNASFYFQNDVGSYNSYGGLLHAGSSYGGNFFGVSAANKTVLISDGASSTGFMIGTLPAQPLIFGTTNLERMRILSGGNVGIGVINPLAKLDISGNAYISSNVAIGTTSPDATDILAMVGGNTTRLSATLQNTNSSGNASFYFQNDRGSYNSYGGLLQGGSAFVGSFFGFSKADATFLIADGVNNSGLGIGTIPAQPLIFGTNNTERMRIGSNGVVTIATSSITINSVPYVFPSSQGAANTVIVNDGSGNLSWSSAYPTAWSSTNTITIGAQTTAPTKATTVQNDFVRYRTKEPAKGINTELIEVDYEYSATSNTGTAAGSGNYLFTLPNGYQFNSTEHPVYTGTNVLAAGSLSIYAIDRGKPQGMVFGDGFYDMVLIVPYSTTQFRIMPIGGNAPNAWVGSGWYPITQNTKVMSFKFQFYRQ